MVGNRLFLGQRGNSAEGNNSLIELDFSGVLQALEEAKPWNGDLIREIHRIELGDSGGVRLTLTDLAARGSDLLLAAAAEDTDNPYDDGAVLGSALGCYSVENRSVRLQPVPGPWKVEGVAALEDGRILLVTDGDDPQRPALLLEATDLRW